MDTQQICFELKKNCILFVSVPPIIEPFSFQDGLAEGMRTRTVCGVSRGKFQSLQRSSLEIHFNTENP